MVVEINAAIQSIKVLGDLMNEIHIPYSSQPTPKADEPEDWTN